MGHTNIGSAKPVPVSDIEIFLAFGTRYPSAYAFKQIKDQHLTSSINVH
jgi:hypothetical protein